MRFTLRRPEWKTPTPRAWLGIGLIAVSVTATAVVIADSREGTGIVLASAFIPAGALISADDVVTARLSSDIEHAGLTIDDVVGHRSAVDISPGDLVGSHMLDSTSSARRVVSIPLGITPATSLTSGSRVELWFLENTVSPAALVAPDALVVATRHASFGDGDVVDLSIASRDQNRVLGSLGADGTFVFTFGPRQP